MTTNESTLVVDVPSRNQNRTTMELALPFYGRIPGEKRWIRITDKTDGEKPEITTITIGQEGCDIFHWFSMEFVEIQEFAPCSLEEWICAKFAVCGYAMSLVNR